MVHGAVFVSNEDQYELLVHINIYKNLIQAISINSFKNHFELLKDSFLVIFYSVITMTSKDKLTNSPGLGNAESCKSRAFKVT